ncbi:enoyl-CoA hydratase/isomerase family protein [Catenovulum sp. 2E275]|uniref:enoyl-CoA hydratase/isomerase family protein n=1 Tax=Catenovulum sp. 2E275 TaxID=2980497 RepID=UPI0021D13569|nr:enoyl-CoA hydratase/isomerase family protein [Catenovulum sp. 2E275]MCU4675633.1 enoyl-CoA hydratase/isomerase family protein [Catenovulum sp. 2E275]
MTEFVYFEQIDGVGYLRFNRPKANAYNLTFMQDFAKAIEAANVSSVNVVIVCSSSEKFFCAGADIKEFAQNNTADNQKMVAQARLNLAAIEASDKIFIAMIAGHALGGGLEIALACDLRFAANGSYLLGLPEIKLGLIPGNGGSQRLTKVVGASRALEILATGDNFGVEQAYRIGLINRLYPADELLTNTLNYAQALVKGPGLAIAATKKAVKQGAELSLADGLALEKQLSDQLYDTQDAKEGFNAFVEKREAQFSGR